MSGSAALSAARKRRASGAPLANNSAPVVGPPYYSKGATIPENIPYPLQNGFPPQQMNIYENIELIKQQLAERTKLIQMQGSSIQPDKLRVLQKQNEIQTQILRQKMAIAQQMEMAGEQQPPQPEMYERRGPVSIQSLTEPEFIYEKGVPRMNPKYKTVVEPHSGASATTSKNRQLTPFVSMILDTGVVPPPIVVLKSHDAKLEEHNHILHNIVRQLDEIQTNKNVERKEDANNVKHDVDNTAVATAHDTNADANDANDGEEGEELLMDVVMNDLTNSREFVEGIVNKIVNETNLSEVIMKIEPLVKENQELRSLIHSQQQMMNEMNTMLLRLLNNNNQPKEDDNVLDEDGLYQPDMSGILSSIQYEDITDTNDSVNVVVETVTTVTTEATTVTIDATTEATTVTTDATDVTTVTDATTADENDNNEDSMPHFPNQISLIVTDIQDDS
jgi:hypothetical protein